MLRIDLRPGEGLDIDNGRAVIRMESKTGQLARLAIEAPKDVKITRLDGSMMAHVAQRGMNKPE